MDLQGDPMPQDFPLVSPVPVDIPMDPPVPADIPVDPPVPDLVMLGPVPLGVFDPVGEFMLLQQTFINNQALNEVILNRMVQIHQDMGWIIPMEDIAPAHNDEAQPDVVAPIDQAEEIPTAPPKDIFSDTADD